MPILRLTPSLFTVTCILLLAAFVGCEQQRHITVQSIADPQATFPSPEAAAVHVAIVRSPDEGEPSVVAHERLSLTERHLLSEVERGAREAGFGLVSRSEADYIIYCSSQTVSGERLVYRRMPVYETTQGTFHTRRGWRTFHGTTTSEVVVPETRAYSYRIIIATVHPAHGQRADVPKPDDESALWMVRLTGDASDLESRIAPYISIALQSWGRTEQRSIRVLREESPD